MGWNYFPNLLHHVSEGTFFTDMWNVKRNVCVTYCETCQRMGRRVDNPDRKTHWRKYFNVSPIHLHSSSKTILHTLTPHVQNTFLTVTGERLLEILETASKNARFIKRTAGTWLWSCWSPTEPQQYSIVYISWIWPAFSTIGPSQRTMSPQLVFVKVVICLSL